MKRILRLVLSLFLILLIILVVRTFLFSSRQIPVDPIQGEPVPEGAISRMAKSVNFPTISSALGVDTSAFLAFDTFLRASFPLVHEKLDWKYENDFSRVYKWGGSNPKLPPVLWLAHLDVVPVEEESRNAWSQPPFAGIVADDYIWGRGTLDDKVNVMGMLEVVEQMLKEGYQPTRSLYLAFGHDEEVGGRGAMAIAESFQRQGLSFEYTLDEGSLIIEDALPGLDGPVAMIGLSEKGFASLRLAVSLDEGGHSSMPPKETAIGIISKAIAKMEAHPFPARMGEPTRSLLTYAGPEMNFPLRMVFANLWLTDGLLARLLSQKNTSSAIIRTTTAPTIIEAGVKENVLPTTASAIVNFRIIPGETPETVKERIIKVVDDDRVDVSFYNVTSPSAPAPVSETSAFGFQVIHKTIRELVPQAVVAPGLVVGATDSRHYLNVSKQTYRFMPVIVDSDDISGIHGIDERIHIDNYKRLIQWYRRLLENSCS